MGETSVLASKPTPTLSYFALATISGTHYDASPTRRMVVSAMHLCPLDPKAADTIAFRASSLEASGMITQWFLAPIFFNKY